MWLVARWPWLGFLSDVSLAIEEDLVYRVVWQTRRIYGPEHQVPVYYERLLAAIHIVQKHRESYTQ